MTCSQKMAPSFTILFWAVLLAPVGLFLGLVLLFTSMPILYRLRNTPKEKQLSEWTIFWLSVRFAIIFVVGMCIIGVYMMGKDVDNYWESQGAWDYWRMPLEEPYELETYDSFASARIGKWKNESRLIDSIIEYEKQGSTVIGYCSASDFHSKPAYWFTFDCTTGQIEEHADKEALEKACQQKGLHLPLAMKSLQENWDLYWSNPNRRKN